VDSIDGEGTLVFGRVGKGPTGKSRQSALPVLKSLGSEAWGKRKARNRATKPQLQGESDAGEKRQNFVGERREIGEGRKLEKSKSERKGTHKIQNQNAFSK